MVFSTVRCFQIIFNMEKTTNLSRSEKSLLEFLNSNDLPFYTQIIDFTFKKGMMESREAIETEERAYFLLLSELKGRFVSIQRKESSRALLLDYLHMVGIERICASISFTLEFVLYRSHNLGDNNRQNLYFLKEIGDKIKACA